MSVQGGPEPEPRTVRFNGSKNMNWVGLHRPGRFMRTGSPVGSQYVHELAEEPGFTRVPTPHPNQQPQFAVHEGFRTEGSSSSQKSLPWCHTVMSVTMDSLVLLAAPCATPCPPAACDCRAPMPRPPLTDHRSHRLAVGALGCAGSRWGLGLVSPPQAAEPGHAQARVPSLPCRLCCRIPPPAPLISSPPVPRATHPPAAGRVRAGRSHDTQSPARGVRRGRGRCLAEKERAASLLG